MSIAVSAVVTPSRLLAILLQLQSCIAIGVACILAFELIVIDLSALPRTVLALVSASLGAFGFYHGVVERKAIHIEISNAGLVCLLVDAKSSSCGTEKRPQVKRLKRRMSLLNDSTLWSFLLVLRLRDETGKRVVILATPANVGKAQFAALSAACHWILRRNGRLGGRCGKKS